MNTNCLDGMACPECGAEQPFKIRATSTFTVYDSGTDEHSDVEWDEDNSIECCECGHSGVVSEFRVNQESGVAA